MLCLRPTLTVQTGPRLSKRQPLVMVLTGSFNEIARDSIHYPAPLKLRIAFQIDQIDNLVGKFI